MDVSKKQLLKTDNNLKNKFVLTCLEKANIQFNAYICDYRIIPSSCITLLLTQRADILF